MSRILIATIIAFFYCITTTHAQYSVTLKKQIEEIAERNKNQWATILNKIDSIESSIPQDSINSAVKNVLEYAKVYNTYQSGDFDKTIAIAKAALDDFGDILKPSSRAGYYNILGTSYYSKDQVDSASVYFVLSANDLEAAGNMKYAGYVYNNLAGIYRKYDDCKQAIKYYNKAVVHLSALQDTVSLIQIYNNKAGCYRNEGQLDSAEYYANELLDLAHHVNDPKGINSGFSILGGVAKDSGSLNKATDYYMKAYKGAKAIEHIDAIYASSRGLSQILENKKQRLQYAEEAYLLAKERYKTTEIDAGIIYADQLEQNHKVDEAYVIVRELYDKRDTMLKQEYEGVQQELMKKFEVKEAEQEIQQKENALRLENLKSQRLLSLLGIVALGGGGLIFLFFQNRKVNRLEQKAKEKDYETRFAQLETMILKSQMNPHFLFNSLNSIRYLFMKDEKERGLKYITKFTKLLRNTLHSGEHVLIPLSEEIELTELYIDLEQLRFEDSNFSFAKKYQIDEKFDQVKIPPFIIQPIVENAFWHGLSGSELDHKELSIDIRKKGNKTIILIDDNGVGMSASKPTKDPAVNKKKSYGLNIIRDRFELLNKTQTDQYSLEINPTPLHDQGTQVAITIMSHE